MVLENWGNPSQKVCQALGVFRISSDLGYSAIYDYEHFAQALNAVAWAWMQLQESAVASLDLAMAAPSSSPMTLKLSVEFDETSRRIRLRRRVRAAYPVLALHLAWATRFLGI